MLEKALKEYVERLNRAIKEGASFEGKDDDNSRYWSAYYEGKVTGKSDIIYILKCLGYYIVWYEETQEYQLFKKVD